MAEILAWTGGQPFLTQKLCKLIMNLGLTQEQSSLQAKGEISQLALLVQEYIINNWESQDEPEHLRTDGSLIKTIPGQSRGLTRLAFSPDGNVIATAGVDNTVKLWSLKGELLNTLLGHRGMV